MTPEELWRDIPGYEGEYRASTLGRVFSVKSNRELALIKLKIGYFSVCLCKNNVVNRQYVHRLVMVTFTGPSKLHVNHKNGIKTDNRLENLEYCTDAENSRHAWATGLCKKQLGEKANKSKLKSSDVIKIKEMLRAGHSQIEISKIFKIDSSQISRIKTGKIWSHVKAV